MADTGWVAVLTGLGGVVLGGALGYVARRYEHLREQRVDAYRQVLATFIDAARTGAHLLSIHIQTGFPDTINPSFGTEQIDQMKNAHVEAFETANRARNAFHTALYGVELVASPDLLGTAESLRPFLNGALYSGSPWVRGSSMDTVYPKSGLNPGDIETKAIEAAQPFIQHARHELWGGRLRRVWDPLLRQPPVGPPANS
jgi:hypothetical protein